MKLRRVFPTGSACIIVAMGLSASVDALARTTNPSANPGPTTRPTTQSTLSLQPPPPLSVPASTVSADTRFCRVASANVQTVLGGAAPELAAAAAGGKSGAAKLRAFVVRAQLANNELYAAAPPGLRKALSIVVQQSDALVAVLERADYDLRKIDPSTLPASSAANGASKTVNEYLSTVCRIDGAKALR